MTDEAGAQHLLRGGFRVAPFSSSVRLRGRSSTQTWSSASTAMWAIWPNSQLLGSGLGHDGSTWNCGTVWAQTDDAASRQPASQAKTRIVHSLRRPPVRRQPLSPSSLAGGEGQIHEVHALAVVARNMEV